MKSWARATLGAIVLSVAGWPAIGRPAEGRLQSCLTFGETRETLVQQKLVAPFRAIAVASAGSPGESVGIKLCRWESRMVYEVAMLQPDGRLVYRLVDASNGQPITRPPAH